MNSNRIWVLGSVVVIIGLLVATWFLGVSPQLALSALATTDQVAVDGQNQVQQTKLNKLKADFAAIDDLNDQLDAAREVVPGDKGQSTLIAEMGKLAKSNKVSIEGLVFADPVTYAPGDSTDPDVVASIPLVSTGNFLSVPITMTLDGNYGNIMSFIDDLQNGTRLVLVHDLSLTEGQATQSSAAKVLVGAETFVLLGAADVPAPASTEAPVATPEAETAQ